MKQVKQMLWVAMVLLFVTAGVFAGGGGQQGSTGGGEKLLFWYWDNTSFRAAYDEFLKTHPGMDAEFVDVHSGDYAQKFMTNYAAGAEIPDVGCIEVGVRQQLLDVDGAWEVLTKAPYNYNPNLQYEATWPLMQNHRGEFLAVDFVLMGSGLAYKRGMAREYLGTDDPARLEGMLKTWDDAARLGAQVYEKSGGKKYLFSTIGDLTHIIKNQQNEVIVNRDGLINEEAIRRIFTALIKLKADHAFDIALGGMEFNASYAMDDHIMYACAPWKPRYEIKPNDPNRGPPGWGVMRAPEGTYNSGGLAFAISSKSKHKERAWEFIKWFTLEEEGAKFYAESAGEIMNLKSFSDNPASYAGQEDSYFNGQNVKQLFVQLSKEMKLPYLTKYDSAASTAIGNSVNALTLKDYRVEELVTMTLAELRNSISMMQ
jgi:multiple sugar transport system substrate-binding protein